MLVKRAAIDCFANETMKATCYLCKPTNVPLFIPNIHVDVKSNSRCEPWKVANIKADKYELNGTTYYYNSDDNGPHIYIWDEYLNMYKELKASDENYVTVYQKVFAPS